jgi:hypothetical protein
MTGIYLFFVAAIWLAIVIWLSKVSTEKLPKPTWRIPVSVVVFAVLLPLPLIDEIVGGRQFEQLCKENSTIQVDRATAVGKTVYYDPQPRVEMKGSWIRIVLQPHRFVDAKTSEFVIGYNTLIATGGRFIQMLGISEGGMPLTFDGSCRPIENTKKLFASLSITALDRP